MMIQYLCLLNDTIHAVFHIHIYIHDIIGKARQLYSGDIHQSKTIPILIHGDASFTGQGVVYECLELSNMPDYSVGGTIHIIINNQIGFTTNPRLSRTSYHCTDVAKSIGCPIFHVNGDDVNAVVNVFKIAIDWRMKFKKDCVVDIVCYRRYGHNEQDDPMITHPIIYKIIKNHPTILQLYLQQLLSNCDSNIYNFMTHNNNTITMDEYQSISHAIYQSYESDYLDSKEYIADPFEWLQCNWQGKVLI
jgi:2-oxoglutarate dehydrogenase E1 component